MRAYLVRPVMTRSQSSPPWKSIQRTQIQRRIIHQHKVSSAMCINLIEPIVDTINVIRKGRLVQTAIRQEPPSTNIIRTNPHGINGIVVPPVRVKSIRMRSCIDEFGIRDKSIDFVDHVREIFIDRCQISRDHVVVAHRSGDGVVVEHSAGVDADPTIPRYASAWS